MRKKHKNKENGRSWAVHVATARRGFTLLELLAVIAITLTLISLSLVGSRSLINRARSTQCLADLRQTGMALTLYANDHNGSMPDVYIPQSPWTWPYILQQGGYFPPKWGSSPLEVPSCRANPNYRATYTYGMNDFLTIKTFRLHDAKIPSRTMLVMDSLCQAGPSNAYRVGDSSAYGLPAFLHAGTANALFWDGHTESVKSIPGPSSRLDNPFGNPDTENQY